ncbi:uncharacterized protein [Penaeus vannamei]|uniref:uncharacterized protein n=1 Tax=Penaeus vannamei TaxID=6689 RepID=UPI00387F4788
MLIRTLLRSRRSSLLLALCLGSLVALLLPGPSSNVAEVAREADGGVAVPGLADVERAGLPWWDGGECRCKDTRCQPPPTPTLPREKMGGTCGLRAWRAGRGQKVISFALYGNNSIYFDGLRRNINRSRLVYPGWSVWLYTDPRGQHDFLCPLLRDYPYLYVCDVTNLPTLGNRTDMRRMLWRALPIGDPNVDVVLSRDTDAKILERETAAVREWLRTNRSFHVMRDHHNHCAHVMGGMWGMRMDVADRKRGGGGGEKEGGREAGGEEEGRGGKEGSIKGEKREDGKGKEGQEKNGKENTEGGGGGGTEALSSSGRDFFASVRNSIIQQGSGFHKDDNDQGILGKVLWSAFKTDLVSHSSFCCEKFPEGFTPFPTQRVERSFVGNKDYSKHPEGFQVRFACPKACRHPEHTDWEFC